MIRRLAAAVLLFATWPCRAQQGATGELTGIVRGGEQPLQGVIVTLTSPALQSPRIAISGSNGGFLFTLLPAADYGVRFALQGFAPVTKSVQVSLTESARADVELTTAPLQEQIVVQAIAPAALDSALLQRMPGPRDIASVTQLSSSANALGLRNGIVIAGAPSWESLFIIDGVASSEYLTGQPQNVVVEDAIQEVAVRSSSISAEYGRFTGGVVSTVTKSGGNEFSGSVRDTLTNPRWTARTPWPDQPATAGRINHGVEATLGGFAIRDRLWFFAAFRNAENAVNRFTRLTNIPYANPTHDRREEIKLTNQITEHHSLIASYAYGMMDERNALDTRGGGAVLDLASLIADRKEPTRLLSATYNGILAQNIAAEVQYANKRYALRGNGGLSRDLLAGTLIVVRGQGDLNAPFGCGICGDDERDGESLAAKTSIYRNTRWGNHTAIIGGEAFRESRINEGTRSSSEFSIQQATLAATIGQTAYPSFGPATFIVWTQHFPGDQGSHLDTSSAYLSDRWEYGRATVNAGARYDRNNAHNAAGQLISNDAAWSPRLGAAFNLDRRGNQQLLASFGRYGAKILENGGSPQQIGTFNQYGWTYDGPAVNGPGTPADQLLPTRDALAKLFAWFLGVGGTQNRQSLSFITNPDTSSIFHGSLQSPSVDERTIGYAVQMRNGFIRADWIARDWHHFYAARVDHTTGQTKDPAGNVIDRVWVVSDNSETVRRYRAVQIETSWQWRGIRSGGSYTLSSLRGNDDEEDGLSLASPRNLPLALWYPEVLGYAERRPFGYLAQDERHRLRAWIAYDRGPFSALVLQRFDSGHPYSAVSTLNVANLPGNAGYALNQLTPPPYYFSARGAFRTDDVFSTDLSLQYQFRVRGALLFAKGDVLNIFDNAAVVAPDTTVTVTSAFNPFTTTPVRGVDYKLGRSFGKATGPDAYQSPRTFRIAFGARF